VSPTVFKAEGLRFFFFSREETKMHIHVQGEKGEAKFWLSPEIALAMNHGLTPHQLAVAERLIRERENEIRGTWQKHFGS
jgi:hypothetical protein